MIDDIIAPNSNTNSNTSDETNWNEDLQQLLDDSMVFVSVSTGTGTAIMGRMERLKATTRASPEFQDPKINEEEFGRWHFVRSFLYIICRLLFDVYCFPFFLSNILLVPVTTILF
jgi:hypothetical protein